MLNRTFNPDLLKVARQARALSQTELAKKAMLTQGFVSKVEAGVLQPTTDAIDRFATALAYPTSYFFESDGLAGLPISMQYRKRAAVGARAIEQLEAEINRRLFEVRRLVRSVDVAQLMPLPQLDVDEYGSAEAVAGLVRRTWLVPSGPIKNLVDLVERAGCLVIACDFQSLGVDGLALRPHGLPPCIFLNSAMPGDRQRFTLAHELGHLVMHQVPSLNMEDEANAFAAELLMPRSDIRSQLVGGMSIVRLAALKPFWRVSMASLLYRAQTLGTLTAVQRDRLWREFSAAGYRKCEPAEIDVAPEQPTVLRDIVQVHTESLGYSTAELAAALHLHESEFLQRYVVSRDRRSHLRVVS